MHALPWPMTTGRPFAPTTAATSRARSKPPMCVSFIFSKSAACCFEHGQRVFRRADAFLHGYRDADGAAQFGKAAQIAARQRLLGVGNVIAAELVQDMASVGE